MPTTGGKNKKGQEVKANNILKFRGYAKTIELPYILVGDFETFNSMVKEIDWVQIADAVRPRVRNMRLENDKMSTMMQHDTVLYDLAMFKYML